MNAVPVQGMKFLLLMWKCSCEVHVLTTLFVYLARSFFILIELYADMLETFNISALDIYLFDADR